MPAAGLTPLRVAPEDVEGAEAGELVKDLGVFNQAKGLMQAVARQMPAALRIAMQRHEHVERSKMLDEAELLARAQDAIGEEGGTPDVIRRILGGRVRGDKNDPFDGSVVIQYETPEGRVGYCAILYSEATFPESIAAYNEALQRGEIANPSELSDRGQLRAAIDTQAAEVQRLAARNAELEAQLAPPAEEEEGEGDGDPGATPPPPPPEIELPQGVEPGDPGYPVDEEGNLLAIPDQVRDELIAAAEEEPPAPPVEPDPEPVLTVEDLPDGVAPGDPGYPVDPETGELIQMPAEVRDALTAAEEAKEDEPEVTNTATAWPEDLSTVELPQGNADVVIAAIPYYSTVVVAALAEFDTRSTVQAAAATELESRPDKPAADETPS